MARVTLGMAVPHSGMLGKAPETWLEDGERDRRNNSLIYNDRVWNFAELKAARAHEHFETKLTPAELNARGQRCAQAMDVLRQVYAQNKPDVAVLIGKDQKEIFIDVSPSLAIYTGAEIHNGPPQRSVYSPATAVTHANHQGLAQHLINSFEGGGFDIAEIIHWPPNKWMQDKPIVPHAYGFLYHQIMVDDPPPSVPVFMNTFYAPTQPSMARSLQFGKALFEAIQAWDSDKTVAIIASGGMSHFVCDEALDQKLLGYFRNYDFDGLIKLNPTSYQSGNSEVKLYAPILYAMKQLGAPMQLADYVPCYRTEAGTGEGCAFMYWVPPK
jgi:3-O-methylgallate 3,4-dioxygenase